MDGYLRRREFFEDISDTFQLTAAMGDQTMKAVRSTTHTIFIQTMLVRVKTSAAQTCGIEDDNSTAKTLINVPSAPGADTVYTRDWGPIGFPLTEGKSLIANVSAAGLALDITWQGYQRKTATSQAA